MRLKLLSAIALLTAVLAVPAHADKSAGNVVDDVTVNGSVKTAIADAVGATAGDINVETYKGHVLLSGFVTKADDKAAAAKAAKGVDGAKVVHDKISVHEKTSMGSKLDDTALVGKVKAALIDAKDVDAGKMNVEARGGVVQLGGFVPTDGMRTRALSVAKGVSGTKRVDDALVVRPQ